MPGRVEGIAECLGCGFRLERGEVFRERSEFVKTPSRLLGGFQVRLHQTDFLGGQFTVQVRREKCVGTGFLVPGGIRFRSWI